MPPKSLLLALAALAGLTGCSTGPSADRPAYVKEPAMPSAQDRPTYSRADLDHLKTLDRAGVFEALGSFDERGMDERSFVLAAAALLDENRVPDLAEARRNDDAEAVLAALAAAIPTKAIAVGGGQLSSHDRELADAALDNRFCFYDEWHTLPAEIDWDHNPGTRHWAMDLNRFTYLAPLTRAYEATGEIRYARKAAELMLDWIAKADWSHCFTGTPYVFGSYLNEAIHAGAWARCARDLLATGQLEPIELMRIVKSLHDHMAYLEIVTGGHHGNWPTIGFQGILGVLGTMPVFRDTERFIDHCVDGFAVQIDEQILPDGVQDELTPHYHRVVVGNLATAIEALDAFDRRLRPRTMAAFAKMVHYMQQTAMPDGSGQLAFNDSDPDVSPASLLERLAGLGLEAMITPQSALGPERFNYAGVAFLRQSPGDGDLYLAFDGGPYGRGHQHEDMLSFELFAYGRRLIGDPGRHLYDFSEKSFLPHLRSTRAHSTIRIDGENQHAAGRPETWIARRPVALDWSKEPGEIHAAATYALGYGDENAIDVRHRREIVFVDRRFWVIFDRVVGRGEHAVESRFQFMPGTLSWDGSRAVTGHDDANVLVHPLTADGFGETRVAEGETDPREGWYSSHYGRIEPAPVLILNSRTPLPWTCATLLWPYKGADAPDVAFALDGDEVVVRERSLGRRRITPMFLAE